MKKWSEIKNEPITWGGAARFYGKYTLVVFSIYAICVVATVVWYYADEISVKIKDFASKMKSKFKKD